MKIAFIWWWDRANEIYPNWRDGLRAAIDVIGVENDVDLYLGEYLPEQGYDFILFWGDSNCPFFDSLDDYRAKKGIILTTDPTNFDNLKKLDVVYCESQPIYDAVRRAGIHAVKAFGTDTEFYKPDDTVKDLKFFYPATFSPWKRQSTIAHHGADLLCIGTVQPDGVDEYEECLSKGVRIKEGYFPPEVIREGYRRAQNVLIPAIHGSERTCLEAMSMGIIPEVNPNNIRTNSYVLEWKASGLDAREFVEKNYSAKIYAEAILKGI